MRVKVPKTCCGYCIYFRYISKCSENTVTAFESNPLGECTKVKTRSVVLKAYKSSPCEQYKPFGILGGCVCE